MRRWHQAAAVWVSSVRTAMYNQLVLIWRRAKCRRHSQRNIWANWTSAMRSDCTGLNIVNLEYHCVLFTKPVCCPLYCSWVLCEYSNYRGRQIFLETTEIPNWPKFSNLPTIGSLYPVRQVCPCNICCPHICFSVFPVFFCQEITLNGFLCSPTETLLLPHQEQGARSLPVCPGEHGGDEVRSGCGDGGGRGLQWHLVLPRWDDKEQGTS